MPHSNPKRAHKKDAEDAEQENSHQTKFSQNLHVLVMRVLSQELLIDSHKRAVRVRSCESLTAGSKGDFIIVGANAGQWMRPEHFPADSPIQQSGAGITFRERCCLKALEQ